MRIRCGYLSSFDRERGITIGNSAAEDVRGAWNSLGIGGTFLEGEEGSVTFVLGVVGVRDREALKIRKSLGVEIRGGELGSVERRWRGIIIEQRKKRFKTRKDRE